MAQGHLRSHRNSSTQPHRSVIVGGSAFSMSLGSKTFLRASIAGIGLRKKQKKTWEEWFLEQGIKDLGGGNW